MPGLPGCIGESTDARVDTNTLVHTHPGEMFAEDSVVNGPASSTDRELSTGPAKRCGAIQSASQLATRPKLAINPFHLGPSLTVSAAISLEQERCVIRQWFHEKNLVAQAGNEYLKDRNKFARKLEATPHLAGGQASMHCRNLGLDVATYGAKLGPLAGRVTIHIETRGVGVIRNEQQYGELIVDGVGQLQVE